jgi:hypothetical protein
MLRVWVIAQVDVIPEGEGLTHLPPARNGRGYELHPVCSLEAALHLIALERVMNSIRNGLGMRETEIVREPS